MTQGSNGRRRVAGATARAQSNRDNSKQARKFKNSDRSRAHTDLGQYDREAPALSAISESRNARVQNNVTRIKRLPDAKVVRRRRLGVGAVTALVISLAASLIGLRLNGASHAGSEQRRAGPSANRGGSGGASFKGGSSTVPTPSASTTAPPVRPVLSAGVAGAFAVASTTRTYTEPGQFIEAPHTLNGVQSAPRTFTVDIYYPAKRGTSTPSYPSGPFPLIVFGPGYQELPTAYLTLLDSWASAGYVVASPVFPLTNPNTPGGADEEDLINQPYDEQYVITRLLAESATSGALLHHMVSSSEIAVAGQSDGGNTALALGYDNATGPEHNQPFRDPRIKAVVVLSGAQYPFWSGPWFPPGSPPLLAVQGTADSVNSPQYTNQYFALASQPKYLLCLQGATHLGPYTTPGAYESLVSAVTLDFLRAQLYNDQAAINQMQAAALASGIGSFAGACS